MTDKTLPWFWETERQVVLERRMEEFARGWKLHSASLGEESADVLMYNLFEQLYSQHGVATGAWHWFLAEREFILGLAVGLGMTYEDLKDLATTHGLPENLFRSFSR